MKGRKLVLLVALVIDLLWSHAQSTIGVTGVRDTSYSTQREYQKLKKDYPQILVPAPLLSRSVTEKKGLVYCTVGSRNLKLDVFYPSPITKEVRNAIVFIHGGGWRSGSKEQHHALAQRLAGLGYVCFTPEYRLSTEALFPAAVHDLKAAVRWVRSQAKAYGYNPDKIAVAGFSAGGELAAFIGNTNEQPAYEGNNCLPRISSTVQAILNLDGTLSFVHPESGEGDDSKRTSAATYWFGYSKKDNPELWKEASPLTHVNHQTPSTLFINSSVARMHAGRDDYLKILDSYGIYSEVKTFEGAPHSFPLFQPWFDSTVQVMDSFLQKVFSPRSTVQRTITVARDGTGDYTTVQAAFNAVPENNPGPVTIYVKNGVYKEKLLLSAAKRYVTLLGEDKYKTVLTYDDHAGKLSPKGDTINTYTSHSFLVAASDFTARNITFENTAGFSAGQAVAIQIINDRAKFINCRFVGNQDVLFPSHAGTRQYFERCYIEGTTDFIFGPSTAWFEGCHIHSKKNSHVTAAATPKEQVFGYVFNDCVFTGDTTLRTVSIGRPWRPYAQVVVMNSYIGPHIKKEGWANWNNTDNYLTTRYAEYKNYGPSATPELRIHWSKQLNDKEISRYNLPTVLGNWNPRINNR